MSLNIVIVLHHPSQPDAMLLVSYDMISAAYTAVTLCLMEAKSHNFTTTNEQKREMDQHLLNTS